MRPHFSSLAAGCAVLLASAAVTRANPPGAASMHTLIWSDEFNGTNAAGLDAAKWGWGQLPWGGTHHNSGYASTIVAGNSYIDGTGNLVLGVRPGSFPASDGTTQPFSEGMIYSQGKFDFAYGYSEVRANVSSATGSWPAFWMLMNGWPPEVDVMEWFKSESNRMHTGLAWNNSGSTSWDDVNTYDPSVQDSWHTWALDWSPGRMAIYKDGTDQRWATSGDRVPTDPMYFILNSGVQSGQTSWWHDTLFDYIRVWKRNQYVYNGSFEKWNGPWYREGNTSVNGGLGRGGSRGMRLHDDNGVNCYIDQPIYGLRPNADYVFTGWGNVGATYWPYVRLGVKNYGGSEVNQDISSNGFTQATLPFTTGTTSTTANVFAYMPTMWGDTVVDDFNVRPAAALLDGGFESADTFYYWTGNGTTYGSQGIANSNARSGGYCLAINGAAHVASGAGQDVVGLKPNTTYRFSGWARNAAPGVRFGVKDFGGADHYTEIVSGGTYTRGTVEFTTGATNTTATVYIWYPYTTGTANVYVDDCYLYEPTAAPWSHGDVGAPTLAGQGGQRGTTFSVVGTGADVWAAADQFHYTYQTLVGDGTITARIRNMEDTNLYCKAGVMLRETLATDSRHITAHWMESRIMESIVRTATTGTSAAQQTANIPTGPWVRIVRKGNLFTPSCSSDGNTWTPIGPAQTIAMPATVYAGLFVNSHDPAQLNEATFDNVAVVPDDSDQDGMLDTWEMATFGNLTQTAAGDFDNDGMTNLQEFLAGTNPKDAASRLTATLARPSPTAPFTVTWSSVPGKQYTILYQNTLGGTWQTLITVPAAATPATSTSYSDAASAGLGQRFYKVQVGP